MKISDLAALVAVRNHISVVINDKNLTTREEVGQLQEARHKLDKIFAKTIIQEGVDALLPHELTIVKVGGNGYQPTQADLEAWRELFNESKNDPDFKIFTHDAVSVTQLEIGPNSDVKVRPAVQPRTIEVTPNVSVTKKGQLTLPLGKEEQPSLAEVLAQGNGPAQDIEIDAEALKAVEEKVSQGDIDKLEQGLDNLEEKGVKLAPAVVEKVAEPIKAPEEKKRKVTRKAKKPAKGVEEDPEFQEALKREKEALKKEGRSNKKVKRANDTEQG